MNNNVHLNYALNDFISDCHSTLNDLQSARTTELCDTFTSNSSWLGFGISALSNMKNFNVAGRVDQLQQKALRINAMLSQSSLIGRVGLLDTNFNGSSIRQAENAEHDFLSNLFFGSTYSSVASHQTANQLSYTQNRVSAVCNQAVYFSNIINNTFC